MILKLPDDIIYNILDWDIYNIINVHLLNKTYYNMLISDLKKYNNGIFKHPRDRYNRKLKFIQRNEKKSIWNLFHIVRSIEECIFVKEECLKLYSLWEFKSRIQYILRNSTQIPTENWLYFHESCEID